MRVEHLSDKLTNGTPLRQIWSNNSFGVCGSDVVLTLYSDEQKKYPRIAIGNSMSSITLQPLPSCRDKNLHNLQRFVRTTRR